MSLQTPLGSILRIHWRKTGKTGVCFGLSGLQSENTIFWLCKTQTSGPSAVIELRLASERMLPWQRQNHHGEVA